MNKMWLGKTNAHGGNIVNIGCVKYKGHAQGHKVIKPCVVWKDFISHREDAGGLSRDYVLRIPSVS